MSPFAWQSISYSERGIDNRKKKAFRLMAVKHSEHRIMPPSEMAFQEKQTS